MPVYKAKQPTKDGRQWQFQVSYKDGDKYKNYRSVLYATKKEAEKQQALWLLENKQNPGGRLVTFNSIIPEFLADKKTTVKPQTYDREVVLCNHVSNFIGGLVISKMTAAQYERFRSALSESTWSTIYKNKIIKQVKALIQYADKKHDIKNDLPWKYKNFTDSAPPKQMAIYTLEQFEQFIACVDNDVYNAYFTFLMFTGTRMNEANALTWKDIDFEKRTANISKSIVAKTKTKDGLFAITSPKTKSSIRTIPIAKRVLNRLKTLQENQQKMDDYSDEWFCFGGKRPLAETSITKEKDKAVKLSGLHRIRVHDFRHSYTSMLVNNLGVDNILLVSRLLGHGSVQETLKTYSHLWKSEIDKYITKLDELEI